MFKKIEMNDSEMQKFSKSIEEWQKEGLINYTKDDNDVFKIYVNYQAVLDAYKQMGEIPIPILIYDDLKKNIRAKQFKYVLSKILAVYFIKFNSTGKNLDALIGVIEIEDNDLEATRRIIFDTYDLENPRLDLGKPFYWFILKKSVVDKYEAFAKKQNTCKFKNYNRK